MKKIFTLLAITFYSISNAQFVTKPDAAAQTSYSKEVLEQIKQVENNLVCRVQIENVNPYNILNRMVYYKVKGLSIAVIQNYKVVWAKAYGWADEQEKKPVTVKTLFHAASISKSINAMAILKLVQDKKR